MMPRSKSATPSMIVEVGRPRSLRTHRLQSLSRCDRCGIVEISGPGQACEIRSPSRRLGMSKTIVLIPAYDEEACAEKLLRKIQQIAEAQDWTYLVLACNDGSRDATGQILSRLQPELPLEILTHKLNRGLGETIRDLFERAAEVAEPNDIIIRLDSDDTHEPEHIVAMIAKIDE